MNNLSKLRAAIIKAVPEIAEHTGSITLADVLRAIGKEKLFELIHIHSEVHANILGWVVDYWNLEKNSLEEQNDECLNFLTSVLCKQ